MEATDSTDGIGSPIKSAAVSYQIKRKRCLESSYFFMSGNLNDFISQYFIIHQLLNQMLSCAVIYKYKVFLCFQTQIPYLVHILGRASQGIDSKQGAFELHLTSRFWVFVINSKIEGRFIGHHNCRTEIFGSQVGTDLAEICIAHVFVHLRFLLCNILRVFAG